MRKNTPEEAAAAKARVNVLRVAYRNKPEYKAKQAARDAARYACPERKAARLAYHAARRATPEFKVAQKVWDAARFTCPERKAARVVYEATRSATPEVKAARAAYQAAYRATILGNLLNRLRCRTASAFRAKGFKKSSKTSEILGCDWAALKAHIEAKFTEGMTWENRVEWHIDHRVPLVSANDEESILKLCHYSNLQPLWKKDNQSKGSKMPFPIAA